MRDPEFLPVRESFYTIQGEGQYSGTPAYFVRLGGCDVGCKWCDVKESWDADKFDWIGVQAIVDEVTTSGSKLAVITGGEPLMYDLEKLTKALMEKGVQVNVETAGVYEISGQWDWICFSPKRFKKPIAEYYHKADELKVVIFHKNDLRWAEDHAQRMHKSAKLFLQPEWSKEKEMTPLVVDYIKDNPKWRISLQTHKYMNIP